MLQLRTITGRLGAGGRLSSSGIADPVSAHQKGIEYLQQNGFDVDSLWTQVIAWSHGDAFNHVNNVHTFTFFESGRMEFLRNANRSISAQKESDMMAGKGIGIILGEVRAKYYRPVVFPDTLLVGHKLVEIKEDRFKLDSICYSLVQGVPVTAGQCTLVTYDYDELKKCAIPDDLRAALVARMRQ